MKKNNNFSWRKYADRIYGINRAKELADKMIKEFPKGGSVYLDDYTEEEVEEARKIYNERKKHKKQIIKLKFCRIKEGNDYNCSQVINNCQGH